MSDYCICNEMIRIYFIRFGIVFFSQAMRAMTVSYYYYFFSYSLSPFVSLALDEMEYET